MNVGVIGSGVVGQVLGAGFISRGHEVKLGTREPGKDTVKAWVVKNGAKASAGTFEETAKFGEWPSQTRRRPPAAPKTSCLSRSTVLRWVRSRSAFSGSPERGTLVLISRPHPPP